MSTMLPLVLLLLLSIPHCLPARVLELSDRFLDIRKDGIWLVKFYAPWCGHCKKLEPIYNHVAQALHDTPILVGRVDCTRFPTVASELNINGFPTIMFLKGTSKHVYTGDRTTTDIVAYAKRMNGPAVRTDEVNGDTFLLFVGDKGPLYEPYETVAEQLKDQLDFFYRKQHLDLQGIYLHKDTTYHPFHPTTDPTTNTTTQLQTFIERERFPKFVKITRNNFQQLLSTKKFLAMVVVEEDKLGRVSEQEQSMLKDLLEVFADKFGNPMFQFGWTGTPDLANSIAMTNLPLPVLLVVNSTNFHHHVHFGPFDESNVGGFFETLLNETAVVYGGNSWSTRFHRTYYTATTSLSQMWQGNPVLTTLLFGLPLGFLSLIAYSICCADIMDEEEVDEDLHEKRD